MLRAALAAIETRDPAARVAELVRESLHTRPAGVARHLDYSSDDLHVHLDVTGPHGGPHAIAVELRPPYDCTVEVQQPGGARRTEVTRGRCGLANVPSGPIRLTFEGPGGDAPPRTQTAWVSL